MLTTPYRASVRAVRCLRATTDAPCDCDSKDVVSLFMLNANSGRQPSEVPQLSRNCAAVSERLEGVRNRRRRGDGGA